MKKHIHVLTAAVLSLILIPAHAQPGMRGGMGGPPSGPHFGGDMAKIFGENSSYTATLEMRAPGGAGGAEIIMPGKLAYLEGKSRFEMDMTEMKGGDLPPQAAAQMKQMGMDKMIIISRPEKNITFMIYPGLQAYVQMPPPDPDAAKPASDFKSEATELGKETVDGHACVKNKVVVTDKAGTARQSTVWNATDLKNFPVKIETSDGGTTVTMLFKDVKFDRPEAAQFEPPAGFKKYDDMMTMMQQEMMKRMGGGRGLPPGQQ
jgi:outer membrane lipoprotein-sorting protein